ncbi:MAG TPA: VOC family protein [Pirellulales bacterium]|nr:VOC family protein [Pirellulales bacterium]
MPSVLRRLGHVATMVLLVSSATVVLAADKSEFARTTIDVGMVVSDAARAIKFYTEAIGFQEGQSFSVSSEFCADAGLDDQTLDIHVLTLGTGPTATKLKLMEVPRVDTKKTDTKYIHSQLGYRYLTIFVADATAAFDRLAKSGVKPLAKGPVPLPAGLPAGMVLCVVRDPDGNLIELIGPKR